MPVLANSSFSGGAPSASAAATPAGATSAGATSAGKFVHQKISQIRWCPTSSSSAVMEVDQPGDGFVTGSWDNQANALSLWSCPTSSSSAPPQRLASLSHAGDVNAIEFLSPHTFCAASSTGSVGLYSLVRPQPDHGQISSLAQWKGVHHGRTGSSPLSCNGLSSHGGHYLASVGEDGRTVVMAVEGLQQQKKSPLRVYEKGGSCSLTDVIFVQREEIVTSNMRGQLQLFDLRSPDDAPASTFVLSNAGDQIGLTCLTKHPTQSHILCTGSQDGMLSFWDLRKERHPVTILKGHDQAVTEVQFHAQQTDHMFSSSENGDIFHWNGSTVQRGHMGNFTNQFASSASGFVNPSHASSSTTSSSATNSASSCLWFNNEAVKHRVETTALMTRHPLPINTLDSKGSSLLVGGDNEAIYVISNVLT